MAAGLLEEQLWQWLWRWAHRFSACCFLSGVGSGCFTSDREFFEAGSYLKVRESVAGQGFFQNTRSLNAGCSCSLIFHVDVIRA